MLNGMEWAGSRSINRSALVRGHAGASPRTYRLEIITRGRPECRALSAVGAHGPTGPAGPEDRSDPRDLPVRGTGGPAGPPTQGRIWDRRSDRTEGPLGQPGPQARGRRGPMEARTAGPAGPVGPMEQLDRRSARPDGRPGMPGAAGPVQAAAAGWTDGSTGSMPPTSPAHHGVGKSVRAALPCDVARCPSGYRIPFRRRPAGDH